MTQGARAGPGQGERDLAFVVAGLVLAGLVGPIGPVGPLVAVGRLTGASAGPQSGEVPANEGTPF